MSKVMFQGDTHSNVKAAKQANELASLHDVDAIIQVGDFGYLYDTTDNGKSFLEECSKGEKPWVFIRGNHDSTLWLKQFNGNSLIGDTPIEIYENVWWCPDGTLLEFSDKKMLMVGGAVSVDADVRGAGEHWQDEITPYELLYTGIEKADILVCHDAPSEVAYKVIDGTDKLDSLSDNNRKLMQEILDESEASIVVHGHYHHGYEIEHDNRKFYGLGHEMNDSAALIIDV